MKTRLRLGLLPKILIAIVAGIAVGTFSPAWLARIFVTFNGIFSQFLGFIIPLLIVGFVAPAIFEIGRKAGKMLVATALIAYAMTFASGMMSYFVSDLTFPSMIKVDAYVASREAAVSVAPCFTVEIEPLMNVMTALVLAFVIGLCLARIDSGYFRNVMLDFRQVINLTIGKVIIPLLPLYIFGIFLSMTLTGEVGSMLRTFAGIILVIFAMHVGVLIVQYLIASLFSRINPFKALWRMMPAYFTALGTQSSAATIPVTLRQTVARCRQRHRRLRHTSLRDYPHVRLNAENSRLRACSDAHPFYALLGRDVCRLHRHARHHNRRCPGCARRRDHGLAGSAIINARIY